MEDLMEPMRELKSGFLSAWVEHRHGLVEKVS